MVNMVLMLSQGGTTGGIENSLIPLYYGIGILALIFGGLWTLKRYADHQKQQNIQQGYKEQHLADKLDANTKAAEANTASIVKLGEKFDSFSTAIDKRITLADYRLDKLEESSNGKSRIRNDGNV